ncbi:hypothetical protein GWN26_06950 [Candidatus Saccharibacteria bacterium]|nr:hypothetical protein [Candidatus Saccharibacteria bacterium]NIV03744.1 hypothetical protein [Calditrichia bacterium]NIS38261.1 hypothetical protein [Candidatus Saccharibacteria bacterium]NIV72041.1 hypothetical protein [Calditrichia bacterium]NIV98889.1 hypothetical protein [Candidatus Saccharibacteria bacterium]
MKKFALFCLVLIALMFFGCAHQAKPGASEPKPIFEEEEDSEDYVMLTDEDVGISRDDSNASDKPETTTASNP